jgi:hypothetical protein
MSNVPPDAARRAVFASGACLLLLLVGACGSDDDCPRDVEALDVTVIDSVTGAPVLNVTGWAGVTGRFRRPDRPADATEMRLIEPNRLVGPKLKEGAGPYLLILRAPGYQEWLRGGLAAPQPPDEQNSCFHAGKFVAEMVPL